jgi:hypothetical protein
MSSVQVIGGALEALQAQARSIEADVGGWKGRAGDALDEFWDALTALELDLWAAVEELEGEEGGADVARQLCELADQAKTLYDEVSYAHDRVEYALDGMAHIVETLEGLSDPACAPKNPADGGDGAGE